MAVVLLLAGCLSDAGAPVENAHEPASAARHVKGETHVAAAMAACVEDGWFATCNFTLPEIEPGVVTVDSNGSLGWLEVSWQEGPLVPAEWFVRMPLDGGGTWALGCGTSPLRMMVAPLVPGTYRIQASPNQTYAGPLDASLAWTLHYEQRGPEPEDPPYDLRSGGCSPP